jgi:integrase
LEKVPDIKLLVGEKHHDTVLREADEKAYLKAADGALADMFVLLIGSAMRPEEANRAQWEMIN